MLVDGSPGEVTVMASLAVASRTGSDPSLAAHGLQEFAAGRAGPTSKRPPVIPDDVDDPAVVKVTGPVTLPTRVRWSAPARSDDLADRRQRARVYEQGLVEGVEQDVREIIDVDELVAL